MWRIVLVVVAACVVTQPGALRPHWHVQAPSVLDHGCLLARAFVRKSGRQGFGVTVELKSRGDCRIELGRAELVFPDGTRALGNPGRGHLDLHGRSLAYEWLPIGVDSLHESAAMLEISVAIDTEPLVWRIPVIQDGGDEKPGLADIASPLPHENGDPARFEEPTDPGQETTSIWTNPFFLWGHGRETANGASREVGLELHIEHADGPGYVDDEAFGITAGLGFAQWGPGRATDALGAVYAEADRRFLVGDWLPLDVGVGPAMYFENREFGAQISARIPLGMLRVRYMATSGIEVMAGFELPIPYFFSRSK